MQAYEGYFENGEFFIAGEIAPVNIKGRKRAFITILDETVEKNAPKEGKALKTPRSQSRGLFKGKIRMSDDFDAPLDDMKEYME
ncbi:MAG: DUF2281 domain-containing protein [Oscillospiraceae bacterium]|nr:DUF2281 domain-containing protein [Oscillospiraceae bacterium]